MSVATSDGGGRHRSDHRGREGGPKRGRCVLRSAPSGEPATLEVARTTRGRTAPSGSRASLAEPADW